MAHVDLVGQGAQGRPQSREAPEYDWCVEGTWLLGPPHPYHTLSAFWGFAPSRSPCIVKLAVESALWGSLLGSVCRRKGCDAGRVSG